MITNAVLGEYLYLQKKVKELNSRIDEIKMQLKNTGSFCTDSYACVVYEQERKSICGLDEAIKALGLEDLRRLGMIRHSKFLIVKVATITNKETADL